MNSDEHLSPVGESSVPISKRMLRRLKKATSISELCPQSETLESEKADGDDLEKPGSQSAKDFDEEEGLRSDIEGSSIEDGVTAKKLLDFDNVPEFNPTVEGLGEKGETLDSKKANCGDLGKPGFQFAKGFDEVEEEGLRSDIEGLGVEDGVTAKRVVECDSVPFTPTVEDLGEKGDEEVSDLGTREEVGVSETTEAGKELLDSEPESESALEEFSEKGDDEISDLESEEEIRVSESKKTGKKRSLIESSESEGKETKRDKKENMTKKERREYLDQLRAENQRLLRETKDAAFQPAPLVRKPISSVLEKIRRRKVEISKQFLSRKKSKPMDTCDAMSEDEKDFKEVLAKEKNEDLDLKIRSKQDLEGKQCLKKSGLNSDSPSIAKSSHTHQDASLRSQTTNFGDKHLEKTPSRYFEEIMTPSILAMNLKLNPSPMPDKSSEEEEYDKEHSNPEIHDSPGDPVRKFIDEDAEEEDDSDNDLLRFDDEDDDDEEDDDLKDMIVSQFKEDPTDEDRRNELHQKWLEQQDAAGTEKLLQKLKRGLQQDETLLSEDEHENADDEEKAEDADNEEVGKSDEADEDDGDPSYANSMRIAIKNIKERIPLMFTDEDDVYVSSDDEEMEKKLLQQRLYKKMELKTKSSSPIGLENPEEILRHIKKPEIKKKTKPSSFKERALMDINKIPAASKSSFLGRLTKSSISEGSRKRGSNVVRGYIFERSDSNSKSSKTMPEESLAPETIIQEKSRPRRAPAKFTASQSQERSQILQATVVEDASTRQRATLYEILKMSSHKTCFNSRETTVTSSSQTDSIFSAFKLDKKPVKSHRKREKISVKQNMCFGEIQGICIALLQ